MTKKNKKSSSVSSRMPSTPDIQQERLQKLKDLFPDLFDGDGRLNENEIKLLTGDEIIGRENYEFTWSGKRASKKSAYVPSTATLTYDDEKSFYPNGVNDNLIIEGDNLEVMKCLLSSYRNSIKCIYIDPPYNKGKDFVYTDRYTKDRVAYWEETGGTEVGIKVDTNPDTAGRYHSNWLCMMYPRLLLSKQLMTQDGVVFVSIDDNEIHNLRRLMNEIFGEENFVGTIVWKNVTDNNPTRINSEHEYILCFASNIDMLPRSWKSYFSDEKESLLNEYNRLKSEFNNDVDKIEKSVREFISDNRESVGLLSRYKNVDDNGVFTGSESVHNTKPGGYDYKILHPDTKMPMRKPSNGYRFPEATYKELESKGIIIFGDDEKRIIKIKKYLQDYEDSLRSLIIMDGRLGSYDLKRLGLGGIFSNPKPVELLKTLVSFVTNSDEQELLLDLFSGSGAFGEAVIRLNSNDSGQRKFILVQLPEQITNKEENGKKALKSGFNKISDITIDRVKKVVEGDKDIDTGFKVYKLTKSHFPRVDFSPDPELSDEENLKCLDDYINEKEAQLTGLFEPKDILDEVLLKNGFKLSYSLEDQPQFKKNTIWLADDQEKSSLICLDQKLHADTVSALLAEPAEFICLEQSLTTDDKWNLRKHLAHRFIAF